MSKTDDVSSKEQLRFYRPFNIELGENTVERRRPNSSAFLGKACNTAVTGFATDRRDRENLIDSFVKIAGCGGYIGLNTDLVSEEAGLTPGSFEKHFSDIHECFVSAWDRLEAIYLQRLTVAIGSQGSWRERLRAGVAETLRLVEAKPTTARFMTIETMAAGEPASSRGRQMAAVLAGWLEQELVADGIDAEPARNAWVLAMIFDRIYRYLAVGGEGDLSSQLPGLMFLAVSAYLGAEVAAEELELASP